MPELNQSTSGTEPHHTEPEDTDSDPDPDSDTPGFGVAFGESFGTGETPE